jgi:hypothetical protein
MWFFLSPRPAGFLTYVVLGPPHSRHSKWPSRSLPPPKAATSPASGSGSGFQFTLIDYPSDPPEVPTCGTSSAPLVNLLAWHAKIYATKREFASVISSQTSAILAAQSATTQLEVAEALEVVAGSRVTEASLRCKSAWRNYIKLYGLATLADFPLVPLRGRGKGKGADKGKGKVKRALRLLPRPVLGSLGLMSRVTTKKRWYRKSLLAKRKCSEVRRIRWTFLEYAVIYILLFVMYFCNTDSFLLLHCAHFLYFSSGREPGSVSGLSVPLSSSLLRNGCPQPSVCGFGAFLYACFSHVGF